MSSHSQTGMHTLTHAWTHTHTRGHRQKDELTHTHAQRLGHTSRHSEQKTETTDNHNHKQEQAHQHKHRHTYTHTQQRVRHMSAPSSANNVANICATRSLFDCHNFYALLSSSVSTHRVDASRLPQNHGVTHRKFCRPVRPYPQVVQHWIGRALSCTTMD